MSKSIMKVFLHPLFRFFFWSAAAIWLIFIGMAEDTWLRWVDFILAVMLFSSAIEYAVKSIAYYRKDHSS